MALRIVGWLLVLFTVLQLALPHFAWERALGVVAGIGMAIVAAVVVLLLVRLFRRGPLRFWWGLLLTTAILAITVGILVFRKGSSCHPRCGDRVGRAARWRHCDVVVHTASPGRARSQPRWVQSAPSPLSLCPCCLAGAELHRRHGRHRPSQRSIFRIPVQTVRFEHRR